MPNQNSNASEYLGYLGLQQNAREPALVVRRARQDCFIQMAQPDVSKLNPHDLALLLKMGRKAERSAINTLSAVDISSPFGKKTIEAYRDFVQISDVLKRRLVREYDESSSTFQTYEVRHEECSRPIEQATETSSDFIRKDKCNLSPVNREDHFPKSPAEINFNGVLKSTNIQTTPHFKHYNHTYTNNAMYFMEQENKPFVEEK